MKWKLAALLAALLVDMRPAPVDACGIKLVVKTSTPRKTVARSSNPSHVLLVGTPPHRLQRELSAAGHDVEVVPDVASAKRSSYAVVVVDSRQADEPRAKFPGAVVVVRSGDVTADIASVENQVARKPVRTDESRTVIAARSGRKPVATGPTQQPTQQIVAAKEPGTAQPAPTPPAPAPVLKDPVREPTTTGVASVQTPVQPPARETTREPARESVATRTPKATTAKAEGTFRDEVYFGLSSASIRRTATLDRAVRWLTERTAVHVVIEGHADPSGNRAANMALSQTRAESVRDYLVKGGIDESRIEVVSYGDTRLKYGRTDPRNRRVAIEPKR